jgi:hypothetical protein
MIFKPNEYSVVFLSYDEPNADANYQRLLDFCPTALRVHGVKGSDTAHKEAAKLSKTEHVIIVDGDNFLKPNFFENNFILDDSIDLSKHVLSYSAYNITNGCQYGNGGIKVWPISLINSMKTHENSDAISVDFNMENYLQLNTCGSDIIITASPLQAWRAGFREGVKLCMLNGTTVSSLDELDWRNFDRLYRWTHCGADQTNGLWAVLGARYGCYYALKQGTETLKKLCDFEVLNKMYRNIELYKDNLEQECNRMGELINSPNIHNVLPPRDSKKYREIPSILRSGENFIQYKYHAPYEIVYVSNDEANSEKNYQLLADRFPHVKRATSEVDAARQCTTDYFWLVDHNSIIVDEFEFIYNFGFYDRLVNRVFVARDKEGNTGTQGAVKLLPRMSTIRMDTLETEEVIILTNYTEQ